jgi:hypothetical protein
LKGYLIGFLCAVKGCWGDWLLLSFHIYVDIDNYVDIKSFLFYVDNIKYVDLQSQLYGEMEEGHY